MIKRICVVVLMVVMLFPASAFANDGGPNLDNENYLTIEYKLKSKEVEIGGEFEFTLNLTNNSKYPISISNITNIFRNTGMQEFDGFFEWLSPESIINPGEKVNVDIFAHIPQNIFWYKIDDEYFCDFDLELMYDVCILDYDEYGELTQKEFNSNFGYWEHLSTNFKSIPLKITNLLDGSKITKFELIENETTFYFPEYYDYELNDYNGELFSYVYNQVVFANTSSTKINNICIYNQHGKKYKEYYFEILNPHETLTVETCNSNFFVQSDLPKTLPAIYQVNFMFQNKYYGVEIIENYPSMFLECPKLKLSYIPSQSATSDRPYTVLVENLSGENYENLYVDFSFTKSNYNKSQIIPILEERSTIEINCLIEPTASGYYFIGLIRDDKLYSWKVGFDSNQVFYIYPYESILYLNEIVEIKPSPSPTPTPADTPTPSPTNPPIEITSITKQSSIPFWMWIVLGAAIIGAGVVIFIIKKKRITHDD